MSDLFEREQIILDTAIDNAKAMKNGRQLSADEYATLVIEYGRLLRQLRRIIRISDRTTVDLTTRNLDLLGKVNYDALTGIYNRRFIEENISRIVKSTSRYKGILSVLMIDVDYFKQYNDTYGHSMGDKCLKSVAKALGSSVKRPDDIVARYGGEEFICLLPDTGESGARMVAEKMIENVRGLNIAHEKNTATGLVSISLGVTTGKTAHTHNGDDYIRQADAALYMSKQNGRNRYTFIGFKES